jgi:D-apionolactonase
MAKPRLNLMLKCFGTDEPPGKSQVLTAGALTVTLDQGQLRAVHWHGVEIVRSIAFLARDRNWGTYPAEISKLRVRRGGSAFSVTYEAVCRDAGQEVRYRAKISASSDGALRFSAEIHPVTDFTTNRTGFVILHPLENVVGKEVRIEHTDGTAETARFPLLISPGQPVFEIKSLKHTMAGISVAIVMQGEKFEMEDQRNWMDASYKTYVGSLLDPWPYTLIKDKIYRQSVELRLAGAPRKAARAAAGNTISLSLGKAAGRIPQFGIAIPMAGAHAALRHAGLIQAARPAHLTCRIDGRMEGQTEAARAYRELSEAAKAPVALELVLPALEPAQNEVTRLAELIGAAGLKPDRIIITHAHDLKSFQPGAARPWGPGFEEMAKACRAAFPQTPLGGGMLSYFTELNRRRPPKGLFDFVTHSLCPIVHAADDESVMQCLESLPHIFASARAFIGGSPYHLGPSGISARENPYGADAAANPGNTRVCLSDQDPREHGLFAAAWNIGLAEASARAGIAALTMNAPWLSGTAARAYPLFHTLSILAELGGKTFLPARISDPKSISAVAAKSGTKTVIVLANLTGGEQVVQCENIGGARSLKILDAKSFEQAAQDPHFFAGAAARLAPGEKIKLSAFSVARLTIDSCASGGSPD